MSTHITQQQVEHVAQLATIPISEQQAQKFVGAFEETLGVIENLKSVATQGVEPTHQVTGLENVMREDIVDETHMLSQAEALANAKRTSSGYFVVPRILDND
jgi:aspartyl-tRNA(Asn)/glutamyl-tRNA(Gln) amidotransferase subunit C